MLSIQRAALAIFAILITAIIPSLSQAQTAVGTAPSSCVIDFSVYLSMRPADSSPQNAPFYAQCHDTLRDQLAKDATACAPDASTKACNCIQKVLNNLTQKLATECDHVSAEVVASN